jgi:RNA polymerase-binding transcription factor DksA
MNAQSQEYRARLEAMLVDITSELSTVGIHNPENPNDWIAVPEELDAEEPDLNLAADNVEAWNERSGLVATLETRYNGIKSAIARIDAGTFGNCEVCNAPIEEKRLAVSPTARTCMTHLEDESTLG